MNLFTPNTNHLNSYEEKGKFIMAWRLSIIFIFIFSILAVAIYPLALHSTVVYSSIVVIAIGIITFLKLSGKSRLAFWIYAVSGSVFAQFALNNFLETAHYSDFIWILSTIIFAFVAIGKIPGMIVSLFHMIGLGIYIAFNMDTHFTLVHPQSIMEKIALFSEMLLGFLTIIYLLNQYLVFQNYSKNQLRTLNENLEEQNEMVLIKNQENITLVKEVHHRVKNNLQIIISLLRMQRSEIENEEAQNQFNVAINRILTMSMIHQKLYQEKEPSNINIKDYLKDLIHELVSLSNRNVPIRIELIANDEYADLKTIVPFGLLINELVANSIKHAFNGNDDDLIRIELKSSNDKKCLNFSYSDNGEWREPKKDNSGFGLELIDILTEQLDGSYKRNGSAYSFEIKQESN